MRNTVTVKIRSRWAAIGRAVIDVNTVTVDGKPLPDTLEVNPTAAMIRWKGEPGHPGPYTISYEYTPLPPKLERATSRHILIRLGKRLIQKGIITKAQGLAILNELKQAEDDEVL